METGKSFQYLVKSIHSLLGLKTQITSSWVDSVCGIIRSLPSEESEDESKVEDSSHDIAMDSAISKIKDELAELTANVNQLNIQRRQLLNEFLDLKGNIRVFCRVRPFDIAEHFRQQKPVITVNSSSLLLNLAENKNKTYSFDKVFHPATSQDDIFLEVEPVIKSTMDGYNACIFAYGQTGTGKTFTMEGNSDSPGVVPRAIEALFKQAADSNNTFIFSFSMLEIYMGYLKDLLISRTTKITDPIPPCLSILTDPNGEVEIDNLVTIRANDFNQAIRLYRLGCHFRSTASTNSNKTSSRSHCMIRISITCSDATERRRVTNKLWLVDLGGSERVLKTKALGRRFEEGKAINLSLSALGDVISSLQCKKSHVPYRNSKLTQVLKDSLGGDSKTLMLVHVGPKEEDLCETICSLNFASRVRSVRLEIYESAEQRVQKIIAMTNLQQKIKQIEDKRNEVRREIKELNEKLENLTKTLPAVTEQLDASNLGMEVPKCHPERSKRIENAATVRSSELPRFMRPTICSRKKIGIDHPTSKGKTQIHVRRRRSSSHHAESVTFPIRSMSECNSEGSISRTSCLVGLTAEGSADNETDYSQDRSDCDIQMTTTEQEKPPENSNNERAHISQNKDHGFQPANKLDSQKFLTIEHWLYLHNNAPERGSYIPQNKRVLAIPLPDTIHRHTAQRIAEKLNDKKVYDYEFTKGNNENDEIKKLAELGITDRSRSEEETDINPTELKNFADKDTTNCLISSSCTSDGKKMMQSTDHDHELPIKDRTSRNSAQPNNWCDKINQHKHDEGFHEMLVQRMTYEIQCSEAFTLDNSSNINISASDVDQNSTTGQTEDSGFSHSKPEKLHAYDQCSETGMTTCPCKLTSESVAHMENTNWKDLSMPFSGSTGNATGICDLTKQKIKILIISIFLGLGFQSLGFDHDFFYALMF